MDNISEKEAECLKQLVVYELRQKDGSITYTRRIVGLKSDQKGYIYKALGMGIFETELTKVPKGYRRHRFNKLWALRYFCSEAIPEPKLAGLESYEWYKKSTKKWLKIKDINKMKKGEQMELILLDRNYIDITTGDNEGNKLYKAEDFFSKAIYTHESGLKGKLTCHGYDMDDDDFEFHIEYKKDSWYPLRDGKLPAEDEQHVAELYGKEMDWTEFPTTTHIGWRGPMIKWKKLSKMSNIYWYNQYRY